MKAFDFNFGCFPLETTEGLIAGGPVDGSIEFVTLSHALFQRGVNVQPILDVLEKGYIPVISTVGCDDEGNSYNINADTAAARIAAALKAESLISMTDIRGVLRDPQDDSSLISVVRAGEAPALIREGVISGGMIPKVECCIEAIRRGVQKVFIIDGRVKHAILIECLTDEGVGTMFMQG